MNGLIESPNLGQNKMWHAFVWLIAVNHSSPYATIKFTMPLQITEQQCRSFAQDFIKSENHASPPHYAKYNCFKEK